MPNYERLIVIGHVGRDPKLRQVGDSQVANFSLAVTDKWTDRTTGEQVETTNWYNCAVWNKQAETIMEYVKKGNAIMLEGKPTARAYLGSDGEPKASLDMKVFSFTFLGGGNDSSQDNQSDEVDNENIPF